jgi:RNA-binding protein 39
LFDPFGKIDYIDIHRDPETGKCKGFAFIQYADIENAKRAVKEMDNIEVVKDHRISVTTVSHIQKHDVTKGDDYLHNKGSKQALMNNLARDAPSYSNLQRPPMSTVPYSYIVMTNMFKM